MKLNVQLWIVLIIWKIVNFILILLKCIAVIFFKSEWSLIYIFSKDKKKSKDYIVFWPIISLLEWLLKKKMKWNFIKPRKIFVKVFLLFYYLVYGFYGLILEEEKHLSYIQRLKPNKNMQFSVVDDIYYSQQVRWHSDYVQYILVL